VHIIVIVELLRSEFLASISPDHNQVDYQTWATTQQHVYQTDICNFDELKQRQIQFWCNVDQKSMNSIRLLISFVKDFEHGFMSGAFTSSNHANSQ